MGGRTFHRAVPVERSLATAGELHLLLRHPEPFFGHGKPVVFVGLSTAPFGLPDALLGAIAILLSLGHRRHCGASLNALHAREWSSVTCP